MEARPSETIRKTFRKTLNGCLFIKSHSCGVLKSGDVVITTDPYCITFVGII
jgi:hypothetical protein